MTQPRRVLATLWIKINQHVTVNCACSGNFLPTFRDRQVIPKRR